jgi:hypothetical protein
VLHFRFELAVHEERFLNAIQKVEKSFINTRLLSDEWNHLRVIGGVTEETLDLIHSYGDKLIDKGRGVVELSEEEIERLYNQISQIMGEIINNEDIDQTTKISLISELRKIEEVLIEYKIRGSSGLEKVGNAATGSFFKLLLQSNNKKVEAVIRNALSFVLTAILQTAIGNKFNELTGSEQKALPPTQSTEQKALPPAQSTIENIENNGHNKKINSRKKSRT